MLNIDPATILQTVPLLFGTALIFIYSHRCRREKRKFDYEIVFLCFADCIALTSAILMVLAAYFQNLRAYISDLGIYIAISGIVVGHISWASLRERIFFQGHGKLNEEQSEIDQIISTRSSIPYLPTNSQRDILIVVDIQRDFCSGGKLETPNADTLVAPINELIKTAQSYGCTVVLSRDWHPKDHKSFQGHGGPYPEHCVQNTEGAEFHSDLLPATPDMLIVNIGSENSAPDYSAFDDPRLRRIVETDHIRTIYITGIALEYCVLATCLDALKYGAAVVAIEPLIRSGITDTTKTEKIWESLTSKGVIRAQNYASRPSTYFS